MLLHSCKNIKEERLHVIEHRIFGIRDDYTTRYACAWFPVSCVSFEAKSGERYAAYIDNQNNTLVTFNARSGIPTGTFKLKKGEWISVMLTNFTISDAFKKRYHALSKDEITELIAKYHRDCLSLKKLVQEQTFLNTLICLTIP